MAGTRVVKQLGETRFVTRRIAGETLIVPVSSDVGDLESIYTLNEVGTRIWQLLDDQTSVAGIVATIQAEYDIAPAVAESDVKEFLDALSVKGLVRLVEDDAN